MYVTTYTDSSTGENDVYIRVNNSLAGAFEQAVEDAEMDLEELELDDDERELDVVEAETSIDNTIVRIINPNNGTEYKAYIILNEQVLD